VSSGDYVRVVHGEGSVEVIARLERRRAEALALKIRGLARRFGLKMQSIRVVPGDTSPDDVSRPGQPSVDSP
jgi:hypothetical protein